MLRLGYDLAGDTVEVLLVEALVGVLDARVEPLVAAGDQLGRLGIVEPVAGDPEATDRHRRHPREDQPVAGPALVVVLDPGSARSEALIQAVEDLTRLDDVRVAGVVAHGIPLGCAVPPSCPLPLDGVDP